MSLPTAESVDVDLDLVLDEDPRPACNWDSFFVEGAVECPNEAMWTPLFTCGCPSPAQLCTPHRTEEDRRIDSVRGWASLFCKHCDVSADLKGWAPIR
jgi:hypothetical protein